MRNRSRRSSLLISLLSLLSLGHQALAASGDRETGSRQTTGEPALQQPVAGSFRFDLYYGYLMVAHGSAGPLKNLNFLVDTGATMAVLDPAIAHKLKLQGEPASIAVVGGFVPSTKSTLSTLSLGPLHQENVPVLIQDLSFLAKSLPIRLDGVVGLEFLGQSPFIVDYKSHMVTLGAAPELENGMPFHLENGLAVLQAQVNGVPVNLMLDSGSPTLVLFAPRKVPGRLDIHASVVKPGDIGMFDHDRMTVRSLRVGADEYLGKTAAVAQENSRDDYAFDGLLSPAALGVKKMAIDVARGELALIN